MGGEQYASSDAIAMLRASDDTIANSLVLPATDPLNFTGRIGGTPRVPALAGHSIVIARGHMQASDAPRHASAVTFKPSRRS